MDALRKASVFAIPKQSNVQYGRAVFVYNAVEEDEEISFNIGDIIKILDDSATDGWWLGEFQNRVGVFPFNYVELLPNYVPRVVSPPLSPRGNHPLPPPPIKAVFEEPTTPTKAGGGTESHAEAAKDTDKDKDNNKDKQEEETTEEEKSDTNNNPHPNPNPNPTNGGEGKKGGKVKILPPRAPEETPKIPTIKPLSDAYQVPETLTLRKKKGDSFLGSARRKIPDTRRKVSSAHLSPDRILKQGFLMKKGHKRRNWKRRWFILTANGRLAYYAGLGDKQPKGAVQVTVNSGVELASGLKSSNEHPHCFQLNIPPPTSGSSSSSAERGDGVTSDGEDSSYIDLADDLEAMVLEPRDGRKISSSGKGKEKGDGEEKGKEKNDNTPTKNEDTENNNDNNKDDKQPQQSGERKETSSLLKSRGKDKGKNKEDPTDTEPNEEVGNEEENSTPDKPSKQPSTSADTEKEKEAEKEREKEDQPLSPMTKRRPLFGKKKAQKNNEENGGEGGNTTTTTTKKVIKLRNRKDSKENEKEKKQSKRGRAKKSQTPARKKQDLKTFVLYMDAATAAEMEQWIAAINTAKQMLQGLKTGEEFILVED